MQQPERFERLDLERADHLAVAHDGLAALVRLLDRRDGLARILLRAGGGVLIQHLVRADEPLHELDHDCAVRIGEQRADAQRNLVSDLVDA